MFEVEQKFRLPDPAAFLKRVAEIGLSWTKKVAEIDTYFQHPSRDFVQTDEALRIRRHLTFFFGDLEKTHPECRSEEVPDRVEAEQYITFKGPRLDRQTKIRKELELPLAVRTPLDPARFADLFSLSAETLWEQLEALEALSVSRQWMEMLTLLGFRSVRDVRKVRSKAYWEWEGARVEFSFDEVAPIGTFAELEFIAENDSELASVRERLLRLSEFLGLTEVEPRSYLALVAGSEET